MSLHVEVLLRLQGDERPIRFQLNGNVYFVEEVLDQWYGPEDTFFKIRADDGNLYILRHCTSVEQEEWNLESFRQVSKSAAGH